MFDSTNLAFCDVEIVTWKHKQAAPRPQPIRVSSATNLLAGVNHRDVTVAVGVALCVISVAIVTIFIWHSSRHTDCTVVRFASFKMASATSKMVAPVTVAPSSVVIPRTGNNNPTKINTTTPSSGAILVPEAHQQQWAAPSERRVVTGRSASRARDDVTSASVSVNRLPLGDLLGSTNYIPYRLRQSYC